MGALTSSNAPGVYMHKEKPIQPLTPNHNSFSWIFGEASFFHVMMIIFQLKVTIFIWMVSIYRKKVNSALSSNPSGLPWSSFFPGHLAILQNGLHDMMRKVVDTKLPYIYQELIHES